MSALRLRARPPAATGRQVRRLLSRPRRLAAGEGRLAASRRFGVPDSAGVPAAVAARRRSARRTTTCDARAMRSRAWRRDRRRSSSSRSPATWAASRPQPGFLAGAARASATQHGALLIFDEVMTGFRVALRRRAGALRHHARPHHARQDHRRRHADRRLRRPRATIMELVAPLGPVYQAGTLSGNPRRHGRRPRDARGRSRGPASTRDLAASDGPPRRRARGRGARGRDPARGQPRLRHVQPLLHGGRPGDRLPTA